MRIECEYGALDTRDSIPLIVTPETSSSPSARVEEDRSETTLPLHHQVKPTQRSGAQTSDPSIFATPIKIASSSVKEYQRENTPVTITSLDDASLDSSVSPSPRYTDQLDEDDLQVRFSINYMNLQHLAPPNNAQLEKSKTEVVLQFFGPKFVLEVMGGAGAVWGFSEAIGLRTSATLWFWRPCTLSAGALFFMRWYRQLQEFGRLYDLRAKRRSTVEGETAHLLWQENV